MYAHTTCTRAPPPGQPNGVDFILRGFHGCLFSPHCPAAPLSSSLHILLCPFFPQIKTRATRPFPPLAHGCRGRRRCHCILPQPSNHTPTAVPSMPPFTFCVALSVVVVGHIIYCRRRRFYSPRRLGLGHTTTDDATPMMMKADADPQAPPAAARIVGGQWEEGLGAAAAGSSACKGLMSEPKTPKTRRTKQRPFGGFVRLWVGVVG